MSCLEGSGVKRVGNGKEGGREIYCMKEKKRIKSNGGETL